jgi:hypothetical protein
MYEKPRILDHGSIVEHTFSRCNPSIPTGDRPLKDFPDVPHHIDNHGECSALS